MLRWAWIALRRSESIASAIARPDGPQAIDEAEIELFVLSIFYLLMSKWYAHASQIARKVCYLHQVKWESLSKASEILNFFSRLLGSLVQRQPAFAITLIAVFWVAPKALIETLSGVTFPNAFNSFAVPRFFSGYSKVGPAMSRLPFGDEMNSINWMASLLFFADLATPTAPVSYTHLRAHET